MKVRVVTARNAEVHIKAMEDYTKKAFGLEVHLAKIFNLSLIPSLLTTVSWTSVLPVFIPKVNNRQAVDSLITGGFKNFKKKAYEVEDVMKYKESEASEPRLLLIESSPRPNTDTMGVSPRNLVKTGKLWLPLKGYAIAQGLYHQMTREYLDPETWTWFPSETLSDGQTALGRWLPDYGNVGFGRRGSDGEYGYYGARLAIPVPLILQP